MMPGVRLVFVLLLLFVLPAFAQRHANLNPIEVDQLRDTAMEPDKRLPLFIKFARERLAALEQVRAGSNTADRPRQIHDKLQDFLDVYDELNDNLDTYMERKNDIRKPLKTIIEADTDFQARLKAFQDAAAASKEDTRVYEFVLRNTMDAVNGGASDHRQLLVEQEELAKQKKKRKKSDSY